MTRTPSFALAALLAAIVSLTSLSSAAQAEDSGKHLFILSGQSNMAGLNEKTTFVPTIEKEYGKENVIIVKDAQGGQPIRRWYKGWKGEAGKGQQFGDLYDRLMKKVNAATEGQKISTVTFLWMQGERDAREGSGDIYQASLEGLLEQLEKDLGRNDVDFVVGRLSDNGLGKPEWDKVREAQVKFAESSPRNGWVDTDDLNDGVNRGGKKIKNDLHYSKDGYDIFGTRLAETSIKLIKENTGKK